MINLGYKDVLVEKPHEGADALFIYCRPCLTKARSEFTNPETDFFTINWHLSSIKEYRWYCCNKEIPTDLINKAKFIGLRVGEDD